MFQNQSQELREIDRDMLRSIDKDTVYQLI